jgi:hypothetical protein
MKLIHGPTEEPQLPPRSSRLTTRFRDVVWSHKWSEAAGLIGSPRFRGFLVCALRLEDTQLGNFGLAFSSRTHIIHVAHEYYPPETSFFGIFVHDFGSSEITESFVCPA